MGLLISLLRIGCTSKSFIFSSISAYTISFPLILCDHISRTTYLSTITFSPWKSSISTLPYTFTPHSLPCCFLPQQPSSRSPKKANLFSQLSDGYTFSSSTRFGSGSHSGSYIKAMLFSLLLLILLVLDWESERGDSGVSKVSGG